MRKSIFLIAILFQLPLFLTNCSNTNSQKNSADSIRRADSIAAVEAAARMHEKAITDAYNDSLIQDSIRQDSIAKSQVEPITQFLFIEQGSYGTFFRDPDVIAKKLKSKGFSVKKYKLSEDADEMVYHVIFTANRNGTSVKFTRDEDIYCNINFATEQETADFIDTMVRSKWQKYSSNFYAAPSADPSCESCTVYAKINGNTVTMISPFEMLPDSF